MISVYLIEQGETPPRREREGIKNSSESGRQLSGSVMGRLGRSSCRYVLMSLGFFD